MRGLVVAGTQNGRVRLVDLETGEDRWDKKHHTAVNSCAISHDGRFVATGGGDRSWKILDALNGRVLVRPAAHHSGRGACACAVDRRTGDFRSFRDRPDQHCPVIGHGAWVMAIAWCPGGERVATCGGSDGWVMVWDARTGERELFLEGHAEGKCLRAVMFSPSDGALLASGGDDGAIRVWDSKSGALHAHIEAHRMSVLALAFSPCGGKLVSGGLESYGDGTGEYRARVWSTVDWGLVHTLEGHTSRVSSVGFSPDGHEIVSGSGDGSVRVWRTLTGKMARKSPGRGHKKATFTTSTYMSQTPLSVKAVAFSPDGETIGVVFQNGDCRCVRPTSLAPKHNHPPRLFPSL